MGKLALSGLLLLVISFSWATVVDLIPASQRPYVGSSGNNSEMSLIFGYNGIERLLGMFGRRGGFPGGFQSGNRGGFFGQNGGFPQGGNNGGFRNGGRFSQGFPGGNPGGFPPQDGFPGQGTPGGRGAFANRGGFGAFNGTGWPGPLRLVIPPLSKEVSWMLPFWLLAALLLAAGSRLRWPISLEHQSLVLRGGWLLTAGIFFSVAGFFHQYYLSTLGPPLAVLVGIGVVLLWRMREQHPWLGVSLLIAVAVITLGFQVVTARAFIQSIGWLPLALALLAAGSILLITGAALAMRQNWRPASLAGVSCLMAAMLLTPGVWSGLTTMYTSENQSLPAAYSGRSVGPVNAGGLQVNQALINYLQPRTQNMKFLMAVPSSMQGADYVLATGRPVLYMGGFMGQDQVVTSADLDRLVSSGQLRYIYWDARGGRFGGQSDISSWVASRCTAVPGFNTAMRNSGAPDGTGSNGGFGGGFFGGGEMQASLYDCGNGAF